MWLFFNLNKNRKFLCWSLLGVFILAQLDSNKYSLFKTYQYKICSILENKKKIISSVLLGWSNINNSVNKKVAPIGAVASWGSLRSIFRSIIMLRNYNFRTIWGHRIPSRSSKSNYIHQSLRSIIMLRKILRSDPQL